MTDRATLITGASGGIGRAIADLRADAGDLVVGIARQPPDDVFPGPFYCADVGDLGALDDALSEIVRDHAIVRLVNNAGHLAAADVTDTTMSGLDAEVSVNLRAPLQCVQACLPGMRAAGFGRILNITAQATLGRAERGGYSATKLGLVGFTRVWARELAADGITVNAIAPGPIETEMFRRNIPAGSPAYEALLRTVPLGRPGRPEEVAAAADFFLGDQSSYVTGQTLYVCGGGSIG